MAYWKRPNRDFLARHTSVSAAVLLAQLHYAQENVGIDAVFHKYFNFAFLYFLKFWILMIFLSDFLRNSWVVCWLQGGLLVIRVSILLNGWQNQISMKLPPDKGTCET